MRRSGLRQSFGVEIDLEAVATRRLQSFARIVAVPVDAGDRGRSRLVVPEAVASSAGRGGHSRTAGELLESLVVFDEFTGPGVPEGIEPRLAIDLQASRAHTTRPGDYRAGPRKSSSDLESRTWHPDSERPDASAFTRASAARPPPWGRAGELPPSRASGRSENEGHRRIARAGSHRPERVERLELENAELEKAARDSARANAAGAGSRSVSSAAARGRRDMTAKKNVVTVTILGGEYTLRTETSPEHAKAVAAYVDKAITETMESGARVESHKAAILRRSESARRAVRSARRAGVEALACRDERTQRRNRPWLPPREA